MSSEMIAALIPIVSVLAVFGFPVAIVFVIKYFKLKERELALEADSRERSQRQQLAIENRVERLEGVLLSLDHDTSAPASGSSSRTLHWGPARSSWKGPRGPSRAAPTRGAAKSGSGSVGGHLGFSPTGDADEELRRRRPGAVARPARR